MSWAAVAGAGAAAFGSIYSANQNAAAQGQANEYNVNIEEAKLREAAASQEDARDYAARQFAYANTAQDQRSASKLAYGEGALAKSTAYGEKQLSPYTQAGSLATQQQQALLGLSGSGEYDSALAKFNESPGQKFLREQQEKTILRNASAMGGLRSGRTATALQDRSFQIAQTDFGNYYDRLSGISATGAGASGQLASQYSTGSRGVASDYGGVATVAAPTYTKRDVSKIAITRPEKEEEKYLGFGKGELAGFGMIDPISAGATYGVGSLLGGGK